MDTALFSGLLVHLAEQGALDRDYIERTRRASAMRSPVRARSHPMWRQPRPRPGSMQATSKRFFDLFRATPRVVTCFSQGVNQSAQGTDKVNAIINCHLATGRIGKPGTGPFSLTGQPNAMGGREVGGLANQLAAHMDFRPSRSTRVGRFWNAPHMAAREGLKAVADVRRDRARRDQGALGHGDQSGRVLAARRRGARARSRNSSCSSFRKTCCPTTRSAPGRMCCCRRPPGARRTAPSPIPNAASRGSAHSSRRRARRSPIGGSSAKWRGAWVTPRPSPIACRRHFPRACRAVRLRE